MKGLAVALVAAGAAGRADGREIESGSPAAKVVTMLEGMRTKIEATGKSEQASYDKFTCWCEDTTQEKAAAISKTKDDLEKLQTAIVRNKGVLGSGGATVAQLTKDIAENIASQKEATEVRDTEYASYAKEKTGSEQCIGSLEAAIKVLTGAGTKSGFLETVQEAKLLSVVADMRPVLKARVTKASTSEENMEVVERFVAKPEDFVKGAAFSQTGQNPLGDFAPQSTQIQGILKGMYDSFTTDLEKDNAAESVRQKAFEDLQSTK